MRSYKFGTLRGDTSTVEVLGRLLQEIDKSVYVIAPIAGRK